jgi:methyltransferase (TIGR00027 family)
MRTGARCVVSSTWLQLRAPGGDSCRGVTGHGGIPADRAQVIVRRVEKDDEPSQTALTAAAARAAHLVVDGSPKIFTDSLAAALLLDRADELLAYHRTHGGHPVLSGARTQVVTRSRYTEDRLAESVQRGAGQYVILGAGLDSFAYRSALAARVRVFEVDHPATQAWKRWAVSRARPHAAVHRDLRTG